MEFLYKLYSHEYFGIGLFMAIIILAFSFLIILFFGKKDEKIRKEEKARNLQEIENQNKILKEEVKPDFSNELNSSVTLNNVDEKEEPYKEKEDLENNISILENYDNEIFSDSSSKIKETEDIERRFDFEEEKGSDKVEDLINKYSSEAEINSDDNFVLEEKEVYNYKPYEENTYNDNDLENTLGLDIPEDYKITSKIDTDINNDNIDNEEYTFESYYDEKTVIEEPLEKNIFTESKEEIPKRSTMPRQFSSVYLSKEKEEEPNQNELEENLIRPIKKDLDMPKPFDLPKLNKSSDSSSSFNDSIIKSFADDDNLKKIFESDE